MAEKKKQGHLCMVLFIMLFRSEMNPIITIKFVPAKKAIMPNKHNFSCLQKKTLNLKFSVK